MFLHILNSLETKNYKTKFEFNKQGISATPKFIQYLSLRTVLPISKECIFNMEERMHDKL